MLLTSRRLFPGSKDTFAYLFGSILESSQFRDIDVALYLPAEMDSDRRIKYGMKVSRETEKALDYAKEVDVRVINDAPVEFQYEVVKTGKVVFPRDEKGRIRFEAQVLSSYMDYRGNGRVAETGPAGCRWHSEVKGKLFK